VSMGEKVEEILSRLHPPIHPSHLSRTELSNIRSSVDSVETL